MLRTRLSKHSMRLKYHQLRGKKVPLYINSNQIKLRLCGIMAYDPPKRYLGIFNQPINLTALIVWVVDWRKLFKLSKAHIVYSFSSWVHKKQNLTFWPWIFRYETMINIWYTASCVTDCRRSFRFLSIGDNITLYYIISILSIKDVFESIQVCQ